MKVTLNPTRLTSGKGRRREKGRKPTDVSLPPSLSRREQAPTSPLQRQKYSTKRTQEPFNKEMLWNDSGLMDRRREVSERTNLQRSAKKKKD